LPLRRLVTFENCKMRNLFMNVQAFYGGEPPARCLRALLCDTLHFRSEFVSRWKSNIENRQSKIPEDTLKANETQTNTRKHARKKESSQHSYLRNLRSLSPPRLFCKSKISHQKSEISPQFASAKISHGATFPCGNGSPIWFIQWFPLQTPSPDNRKSKIENASVHTLSTFFYALPRYFLWGGDCIAFCAIPFSLFPNVATSLCHQVTTLFRVIRAIRGSISATSVSSVLSCSIHITAFLARTQPFPWFRRLSQRSTIFIAAIHGKTQFATHLNANETRKNTEKHSRKNILRNTAICGTFVRSAPRLFCEWISHQKSEISPQFASDRYIGHPTCGGLGKPKSKMRPFILFPLSSTLFHAIFYGEGTASHSALFHFHGFRTSPRRYVTRLFRVISAIRGSISATSVCFLASCSNPVPASVRSEIGNRRSKITKHTPDTRRDHGKHAEKTHETRHKITETHGNTRNFFIPSKITHQESEIRPRFAEAKVSGGATPRIAKRSPKNGEHHGGGLGKPHSRRDWERKCGCSRYVATSLCRHVAMSPFTLRSRLFTLIHDRSR
jgi:hypothetical protein